MGVTRMVKYTLEEFMYGDKYGIESTVFVEVSETCCQDDMRTTEYDLCQARTVDSKKMIEESDSISDIPELELPFLCEEEKMQILEEFWYGNINPVERPFQR